MRRDIHGQIRFAVIPLPDGYETAVGDIKLARQARVAKNDLCTRPARPRASPVTFGPRRAETRFLNTQNSLYCYQCNDPYDIAVSKQLYGHLYMPTYHRCSSRRHRSSW